MIIIMSSSVIRQADDDDGSKYPVLTVTLEKNPRQTPFPRQLNVTRTAMLTVHILTSINFKRWLMTVPGIRCNYCPGNVSLDPRPLEYLGSLSTNFEWGSITLKDARNSKFKKKASRPKRALFIIKHSKFKKSKLDFQLRRLQAASIHREPAALTTSSVHLVCGHTTLPLPIHGCHSRTYRPQRSSVFRLTHFFYYVTFF